MSLLLQICFAGLAAAAGLCPRLLFLGGGLVGLPCTEHVTEVAPVTVIATLGV